MHLFTPPWEALILADGPTTVHRELNPFNQSGLDTIDTEIVSMSLSGTTLGVPVEIRAGEGNGFFAGLPRTGGQIQDVAGPPDGTIDYPADSFFDVFFDIWIDLNDDDNVEEGEVVQAARIDVPGVGFLGIQAVSLAVFQFSRAGRPDGQDVGG